MTIIDRTSKDISQKQVYKRDPDYILDNSCGKIQEIDDRNDESM